MEWSAKGQEYLMKARRLHHMAIDFYRRQEFLKTLQYLHEALKFRRCALDDSHPQIIATLEFLIFVTAQCRPCAEVVPLLKSLLAAKRERFGGCHLETEQTMSQLSSTLEHLGRKEESEELNREIWKIRCMSSSQRQANNFEESLSHLKSNNARRKKAPTLLNPLGEDDGYKPNFRTSKFVESDDWLVKLKELAKVKPEQREALKAKWDAEEQERKMKTMFSDDFLQQQQQQQSPGGVRVASHSPRTEYPDDVNDAAPMPFSDPQELKSVLSQRAGQASPVVDMSAMSPIPKEHYEE